MPIFGGSTHDAHEKWWPIILNSRKYKSIWIACVIEGYLNLLKFQEIYQSSILIFNHKKNHPNMKFSDIVLYYALYLYLQISFVQKSKICHHILNSEMMIVSNTQNQKGGQCNYVWFIYQSHAPKCNAAFIGSWWLVVDMGRFHDI